MGQCYYYSMTGCPSLVPLAILKTPGVRPSNNDQFEQEPPLRMVIPNSDVWILTWCFIGSPYLWLDLVPTTQAACTQCICLKQHMHLTSIYAEWWHFGFSHLFGDWMAQTTSNEAYITCGYSHHIFGEGSSKPGLMIIESLRKMSGRTRATMASAGCLGVPSPIIFCPQGWT